MGAIIGAAAIGAAGTLGAAYMSSRNKGGGGGSMPASFMTPKQMAKEQLKLNRKQAELNLKLLPRFGEAERSLTEAQRTGDYNYLDQQGGAFSGLLQRLSPGYAAINRQSAVMEGEINGANPYARQLDFLNARLGRNAYADQAAAIRSQLNGPDPMAGEEALVRSRLNGPGLLEDQNAQLRSQISARNPLYEQLQAQAQNELALGGQLSAEDERTAAQSARAGAAARGMATGNGSLFAEALNRDRFAQGRLNERRNFATGVIGTGLNLGQQQLAQRAQLSNNINLQNGIDQGNLGWLLNSNNARQQSLLSNRGLLLNAENSASANDLSRIGAIQNLQGAWEAQRAGNRGMLLNYGNAQLAPVLGATLNNRSVVSTNAPAQVMQGAPQIATMTGMADTAYNASIASGNSAANNQAALLGAGIGGVSQLGSAYMMSRAQNQPMTAQPDYYMGNTPVYRGIQVS